MRVRTKASKSDTRTQNRRFVLQRVYADAPTTRADIVRATGLTAATVSDLISDLIEDGLVREVGTAPSTGGKPPVLVDIDADNLLLITIDLSGSKWRGSVRNARHEIIYTTTVPHRNRRGDEALTALQALVDELVEASPVAPLGVGVGTPGVVTDSGVVVEAANLGWADLPLADVLGEGRDFPVHVVNDSRATAIAEFLLGEHDTGNMIVVRLGRGVGSGIILDRNIYSGESAAAGEIGHIAVIPRGDDLVTLESVASTPAIAHALADAVGTRFVGRPSQFIDQHSDVENPAIVEVIDQLGSDLATILASVVGTLDVHRIVLSGPVAPLGDQLLESIQEHLSRRLLPALSRSVSTTYGRVDESSAITTGVATYVIRRELGIA